MANFTKHAADAFNAAPSCAQMLGHDCVGCEHILLAILAIPQCEASKRLTALGFSLAELAESMKQTVSGPAAPTIQLGQLPLTARVRRVLAMAEAEAGKGNDIGTLHILVAMLREGENAAAQLLFNAGVSVDKIIAVGTQKPKPKNNKPQSGGESETEDADFEEDEEEPANRGANGKAQKTPTVNAFGRDLTALAKQGKLDPVIGRKKELKRIIQVLSRRTKNNAVLIGEAGVGKTAVVEGLAQAIYRGEVPERMQEKRVVAIDMARVVAGTQYRGQFEERLKKIVDETKRAGNIILFLDEIHTMVGAGGAEGAMDAANILKPALARGELQCVGATTLKEYHKSIEKDAALERRFQSVQVEEPSIADTIEILRGIATKYEEFHGVKINDAAIRSAVELTARYLPARQLPDKAIDAIDETGARMRAAISARPPQLIGMRDLIDEMKSVKNEAIASGDFDMAAECRGKVEAAESQFALALQKWRDINSVHVICIDEADVAETVSSMSGIPVEKMDSTTSEKLLGMEKSLEEVVIGQEPAIKAIARALRRSRALQANARRPIGSFLFLGPTGVGKTHLAKMLAERVYGDDKALITLDMSEFQEKYSSSRLVGAPPGYVGYDEGGQLTEKVRRRPYSVVLFDEFEKANSDVCNMLLQILDEGRLTDGQGRIIDFRNTIIICTANLGFDFAREGHSLGFATTTAETSFDMLKEKLMAEAKRTFRPELLNRFDDMVVFRKLEKEDMKKILAIEIDDLSRRLKDTHISLSLDAKAIDFLIEKGYDSALGARPLRRVVQEYVEDPLADAILAGKAKASMRGKLDKDGKTIRF